MTSAEKASLGEMVAFWRQGGLRLVQPLAPRGEAAATASLLIQPDGDVVLSVPSDFGVDPGDLDAGRALVGSGAAAIRRIARNGYGQVSRSLARMIDVGGGGLVLAMWGGMAAAEAAISTLVVGAALTLLAAAGRLVFGHLLMPRLQRMAFERLRRSLE